jgi:hypothetical protein
MPAVVTDKALEAGFRKLGELGWFSGIIDKKAVKRDLAEVFEAMRAAMDEQPEKS